MNAAKKFIFAFFVITSLGFSSIANALAQRPWDMQDKKPPEKVKEQPKPDDRNKNDRRDNDRKDDKKDEKKKP